MDNEEFEKYDLTDSQYQAFYDTFDQLENASRRSIYRKQGILSVTDLVAVHWCETQVDYALRETHGLSVSHIYETEAMRRGTERHDMLEKEIHNTLFITDIATPEDQQGLKWCHLLFGLRELQQYGLSREFPVMAILVDTHHHSSASSPVLVCGVIDEIYYQADPQVASTMGKIKLREVKTRSSRRLPSLSQQKQAEFQLMLYGTLLHHMATKPQDLYQYLEDILLLDMHRPLSNQLYTYLMTIYNTQDVLWWPFHQQKDSIINLRVLGLWIQHELW
jgi:hypothetical protein